MILRGSVVILGPSETAAARPNRAGTGSAGFQAWLRPAPAALQGWQHGSDEAALDTLVTSSVLDQRRLAAREN